METPRMQAPELLPLDSAYEPGLTIQQVAQGRAAGLLAIARTGGSLADERYSVAETRCVQVLLEGGGPSCDVTLRFNALHSHGTPPVEGWVTYYEASGQAAVYLDSRAAEALWLALFR